MLTKKAIVLDSSAFIAGFDPFSIKDEVYSVPLVKMELRDSMVLFRFETALSNGALKVVIPLEEFVEQVVEASKKTGDYRFLSNADIQVLALALQLKNEGKKVVVVTDDYSIQNVASQLGLEFAPLATFGIKFHLDWLLYCPACKRKYPADYKLRECETCGTVLKRKPLKKRIIGKKKQN